MTLLVATWEDGLFVLTDGVRLHELEGQSLRGLAADGRGGALAVVGGHSLRRRTVDGEWITITSSSADLACCMAVGDVIYLGTDDARVLRVEPGGEVTELSGFNGVPGRDTWYAGAALIDGKLMGPPLGVRSMSATPDGVLLVNVHVGGVPRSRDGGATWQPTIDVAADVHEVRAHPSRPGVVAAASAAGLCLSRDHGSTWEIETAGLHAPYCAAVAFSGDDVLVTAATDHFAPRGALYRRSLDESGPLVAVTDGLPEWTERIADTGCLAAQGSAIAVADGGGNVYVSHGSGWSRVAQGLPAPSGVLFRDATPPAR